MINDYLKGEAEQEDHVIHLLFSANRWEAAYEYTSPIATRVLTSHRSSIRDAINKGTTVIIDRYYYSGCVYSAAKDNPTLSLTWARHPEVGLPRPDGVIFLEISPDEAAKRGGFGGERYETKRLQDRVRELFKEMSELPDESEEFVVINANGSLEEVAQKVWEAARHILEYDSEELASVEELDPAFSAAS